MKLKIALLTLATTVGLLLSTQYLYSNGTTGAPPAGYTGAPGNNNCTSCHAGTTLNGGGGSVVISVNSGATTYSPGGGSIPVTVTVADPLMSRFGFELLALDASNANAGTLSAGIGTVLTTSGGKTYVSHSIGVTASNFTTFSFNWTPPASNVGNITFYTAAVAGNNNANNSGDHVYSTSVVLSPGSGSSTAPVANFNMKRNNTSFTYLCSGDTVVFNNTSTGTGGTTTYAWDIDATNSGTGSLITGSGHQSSSTGPLTAVYTNTGTTPITVTAGLAVSNGFPPVYGTNADSQSYVFVVYPKPSAAFTVSQQPWSYCANEIDTLTINNPIAGMNYTVNWATATLLGSASNHGPYYFQLPSTQGSVSISVTAANSGGQCASSATPFPPVYAQSCAPSTAFLPPKSTPLPASTTPVTYCNGINYYYTDSSSISSVPIVSYSWTFGGGPSIPVPPTASGPGPHAVMFPMGGIYVATETLTDIIGNQNTMSQQITIINCNPIPLTAAMYPAGPVVNTCLGMVDTLVDVSYGGNNGVITWEWNWGDATPHDYLPYAYHQYAQSGTYNASLIVGDGAGFDTAYITYHVIGYPAASVGKNDTICAGSGSVVSLGGTATPSYTYHWFPSAGLTPSANVANPSVSPALTTTYYQTVTEPIAGCATTDSVIVFVGNPPNISINVNNPAPCIGQTVTVTCSPASFPPPSPSFNWSWGGGNIISGNGAGPFQIVWNSLAATSVGLTITDQYGCAKTASPASVNPSNCGSPVANFGFASGVWCTNTAKQLTDSSLNVPTSWTWNFGSGALPATSTVQNPSITFTTPGVHIISLTVSNFMGVSTKVDTVIVNATPSANFNAISPVCINVASIITYTGNADTSATYNWGFSGGVINSGSGQGPYNVYWPAAGNQVITLSVTQNGCISYPANYNLTVNGLPTAKFKYVVNPGLLVSFTNQSIGATSYVWSGSDNFNSTLTNPIHAYSNPGNYAVCLMANNGLCSSQTCDTISVNWPMAASNLNKTTPAAIHYANEEQSLIVDQLSVNATLYLYTSDGALVQSFPLTQNHVILPVKLNEGIYMAVWRQGEQSLSRKFVVSH
jgi:PKD repeat protein